MHISRFEYASDPSVEPEKIINCINSICGFANVSTNFFGFKEAPKGIEKSHNFTELKDWAVKTLADALKTKGQLDDFINYIMTRRNNISSQQRNMVSFFRRKSSSPIVANNQYVQDFLKDCQEISNISNNSVFINLYESLSSIHCVNLFLLGNSSGTQVNPFDNLKKFHDKYPILSVVDTLYRDWETDRKSTRLNSSHLKLSRMPSSA